MGIEIKIDTGVPNIARRQRANKYPYEQMRVGDSFISGGKCESTAYALAKAASYKYAPKKFQAGRDAEGNRRVWRTA